MSNTITIRAAVKADIPQLLELYAQLNPLDEPVDANVAAAVFEQAVSNGVTYFVAGDGGRVVGTCYIAIIPNITRRCSPIGFIENVVTAAEYRRRGVGRKLMDAAVRYAKAQGCYKVTLQSGSTRTEAHKFYEAMGFNGDSKRAFEIRF
jgi:ribosomal protein S18 acetylase RimI-like enzyme